MSERNLGPKILGIILLGFPVLNYFIAFFLKFANIYFVSGVSMSQPYVEEMVYYESYWGNNTLEIMGFIISLFLLALIAIKGIDMKLKYNLIFGGSLMVLLLNLLAILPFRLFWLLYTLNDGFFMPIFIVLFLALINFICFLLIVIISKLKIRKL
jgi:hypothetical protein